MAPELAAKFPEIKTYAGQGLDDPTASVRFDWTPAGFHAMILSAGGTIYVDPYARGNTERYISYNKSDFSSDKIANLLPPIDPGGLRAQETADLIAAGAVNASGNQLRTYRLAVSATGEYTAFHGGTVAAGLAAITTTINRVTAIYEVEVSVRLMLVANNNLIVYTNAATDPYTNGDSDAMLAENQTNIDAVIGSANYDVGHVVATDSGGVAGLGVICDNAQKAQGVTGSSSPVGDPFDVDYVAHELGHQFSGEHTFNATTGSCSGNGSATTAYEPGSGTTIQAYAGICDPQNIQANSNDYFHTISFDQIVAHTTAGGGSSCAVVTDTGNNPPVVNANATGINGKTIPINTPFTLTGSATDPNGHALTYNWEQFDLGPFGHPNTPTGNAPIFRSFPATTSPSRTFPRISDIVNNTQTMGEILPTYTRGLTFRLTARDNQALGGGVDHDQIAINVTSTAGPFLVTAPNTAVTWDVGTNQNVTWNVASTNLPPVSCTTVDISLSTDGGMTYPTNLAAGVANDGSESVTVPNNTSATARVKVACANNIFFDISNVNFSIQPGGGPTCTTYASTDVPKAISDTDTSTITSTLNVPTAGTITDINVLNLNGTHTWFSDLDFKLTSPATTEVPIMDQTCNDDNQYENFNLNLDDEATPGAWPCPPIGGGTYQPNNPLSAFDGQSSNGTWTLTVNDNFNQDGGSLNSWSLEICAIPSNPVTATPTPTATDIPTATPTSTATATPTSTPTATPIATATATPTATPVSTPDCKAYDLNDDGFIDLDDINAVLFNSIFSGVPYDAKYDLVSDGVIDIADVFEVAIHFGEICPS